MWAQFTYRAEADGHEPHNVTVEAAKECEARRKLEGMGFTIGDLRDVRVVEDRVTRGRFMCLEIIGLIIAVVGMLVFVTSILLFVTPMSGDGRLSTITVLNLAASAVVSIGLGLAMNAIGGMARRFVHR